MMVLDTTILIDALHRKDAALKKIAELEGAEETICTTQINVLELYKGAYIPTKSTDAIQKVKKMLDAFVVLFINDDAYECFAALSALLKSSEVAKRLGHFLSINIHWASVKRSFIA